MSRNLNGYKDEMSNIVCKGVNRPDVLDSVRPFAYEKEYNNKELSLYKRVNFSKHIFTYAITMACLIVVIILLMPTDSKGTNGFDNLHSFLGAN